MMEFRRKVEAKNGDVTVSPNYCDVTSRVSEYPCKMDSSNLLLIVSPYSPAPVLEWDEFIFMKKTVPNSLNIYKTKNLILNEKAIIVPI